MSWFFTNLIAAFLLPPLNLLLLSLLGMLLWRKHPRVARILLGGAFILLWLLSTPFLSEALLHTLEQGEAPLSPGLAARLLVEFARQADKAKPDSATEQEKTAARLTQRQADVLNLVAQGKTYKEVGAELNLTERTIKYHMEKILEMLQLENRSQAIAYAARTKADTGKK